MPRLRNAVSGVVVSVSDETAALLDSEWKPVKGSTGKASEPDSGTGTADPKTAPTGQPDNEGLYAGFSAAELKAEIESRNADREDGDKLSVKGNKPTLIAALEADDAAADAASDESSD